MVPVQGCTYALLLVEDREAVIYFYRNLLVLYLLLALHIELLWPRRTLPHSLTKPDLIVAAHGERS